VICKEYFVTQFENPAISEKCSQKLAVVKYCCITNRGLRTVKMFWIVPTLPFLVQIASL
jgi:hypothetical protein